MDEIDAIVEDVISKLQYADYLTKPMMVEEIRYIYNYVVC